ncbi:MAG: hypothetical protein ACI4JS_03860 [Oscillospiraceae bacterium]
MAFLDFFRNLFGGNKPKISSENLVLDVSENKLTVNGKSVDIPCHLSVLTGIFGKPRKFVGKNSHVNYTWDDLGLYCYTMGNNVVYCIAVKVNLARFMTKFYPKCPFKGTLTIFGEQWEEFIYCGEDRYEIYKRRVVNGLALSSEYVDGDNLDRNGCHGAYSVVEIQWNGDLSSDE